MDRAAEAAHLSAIRSRVAMLDGQEWLLGSEGGVMQVDARGEDGSLITIISFSPKASFDEMQLAAGALQEIRFLLGLLDRAIVALRAQRGAGEQTAPRGAPARKDHAAEAAMLCSSPAFKRFLMERHGLDSPATDERTAQRLRSVLAVTSRAEINASDAVRDRWLALRADFNIWKGRALA